jgi:predicted dehydrogenase
MRFALLGDHPDGKAMAAALVASGRHERTAYAASADVEEVLADPTVEAVIAASGPDALAAQVRRALQSERHVLCVYPPGQTPDIAYEADMIRKDVGRVLLPLLTGSLHPAVRRLAEFVRRKDGVLGRGLETTPQQGPVGALRLVEMEQAAAAGPDVRPAFPGWDLLRALGGEIAEVSAMAAGEHAAAGETVLASGRFERGGLFQAAFHPELPDGATRLAVIGDRGQAELDFPVGPHGPAFLDWRDETGELREEAWDAWDPWPALVRRFEDAVAGTAGAPAWLDAVRGLELDDAARRSVERRRTSLLEYQETSEETGFKGTMTLVGCGLLWGLLVLLGVSYWFPPLRWVIVGLLVLFLGLQFLRYLIPRKRG